MTKQRTPEAAKRLKRRYRLGSVQRSWWHLTLFLSSHHQRHIMYSLSSSSPSVINTNEPPTREELAKAIAQGTELANKIAKATLELERLEAQRDDYKRLIYQHKARIAPINQIPEDILLLIFIHCLPTAHNAVMSATQAPILLTHVCREWRALSLGSQDLWSSLYIPIPNLPDLSSGSTHPDLEPQSRDSLAQTDRDATTASGEPLGMWRYKMEKRKDLIVEWFRRAGTAPLSITLIQWWTLKGERNWSRYSRKSDSSEEPVVKEIIKVLKAHARQWRVLELSAVDDIIDELLALPATDTPNIQAVRIASGSKSLPFGIGTTIWDGPKTRNLSNGSVVASPTLRSLDIQRFQGASLESMPVRWSNLTKFVFCGYPQGDSGPTAPLISFTPSQALDLLEKCPSLVECGIAVGSRDQYGGFIPPIEPDDSRIRQVMMAHLESLWVHEQDTYPLNNFFACLDVPRLSSLKFITNITPRTEPSPPTGTDDTVPSMQAAFPTKPRYPPSLPVLLRTCGATIKSLGLDYTFQTNESLQECLRLVPDVEDLRLSVENEETINLGVNLSGPGWGRQGSNDVPIPAYMDDELFERLFVPPEASGERALCPKMTSLFIELVAAGLTEDALLEFVKVRRSKRAQELGISHIQVLRVEFATEAESAREKRCRELVRRGVRWGASTEWLALQELEGLPNVDLEGFRAEISWPMDQVLVDLLTGSEKVSVEGPWSPAWALHKVTEASSMRAIQKYFASGL